MMANGRYVGKHAAMRYMPVSTNVTIMRSVADHVPSTDTSALKNPAKRTIDVIKPLRMDVSVHFEGIRIQEDQLTCSL